MHFLPFNPVDKRTAITYIDENGEWYRSSKGAPEQVIETKIYISETYYMFSLLPNTTFFFLRSLNSAISKERLEEKLMK